MAYEVDSEKIRLDTFIAEKWAISRSNAKTVIEKDGAFVNGVNRKKVDTNSKKATSSSLNCLLPKCLKSRRRIFRST